jgi:hypothetical protein
MAEVDALEKMSVWRRPAGIGKPLGKMGAPPRVAFVADGP